MVRVMARSNSIPSCRSVRAQPGSPDILCARRARELCSSFRVSAYKHCEPVYVFTFLPPRSAVKTRSRISLHVFIEEHLGLDLGFHFAEANVDTLFDLRPSSPLARARMGILAVISDSPRREISRRKRKTSHLKYWLIHSTITLYAKA